MVEKMAAVGNGTPLPRDYAAVLADLTRLIAESRRRALANVNRELVWLYWQLGRNIAQRQETAQWGDAVVTRLAGDLKSAFPELKGLSRDNLFRMRQLYGTCRRTDRWLLDDAATGKVGTAFRQPAPASTETEKVGSVTRHSSGTDWIVAALSQELTAPGLAEIVVGLSWTHHYNLLAGTAEPDEHYFYMAMAMRERWSVRELKRQLDSGLFTRYISVREHPDKCLPPDAERGELLPFKDHYLLDFLGLEEPYTENQLRKAMLANLRALFLELGRDFALVGEEYPLTVGKDTFRIDLLFYHRRLQCLVAMELKNGRFRPEYVGKCQFYLAALDEQARLPHEKPSIGLVLCKTADDVQLRLALTDAARKIGVATYQTALPEERLIRQRLERLTHPGETES